MLRLILVHGNNHITNKDHVGENGCEGAGVRRIACRSLAPILSSKAVASVLAVPPKTRLTVRKYDPMGTQIMANVKAKSLKMVSLQKQKE